MCQIGTFLEEVSRKETHKLGQDDGPQVAKYVRSHPADQHPQAEVHFRVHARGQSRRPQHLDQVLLDSGQVEQEVVLGGGEEDKRESADAEAAERHLCVAGGEKSGRGRCGDASCKRNEGAGSQIMDCARQDYRTHQ